MKYTILSVFIILAGCGAEPKLVPPPIVEVRTVEVQRPAPIIPSLSPLDLQDIEWHVLTEATADGKFATEDVFYGLNENDYKDLSLNISALRAYIQEQIAIIQKYKESYQNGNKNKG